jgi:hypothetical protein
MHMENGNPKFAENLCEVSTVYSGNFFYVTCKLAICAKCHVACVTKNACFL